MQKIKKFYFENLKKNSILLINLIGFFTILHVGIPIYINSPFLSTFTTEQFVGIIFIIGSLLSILGILATTKSIEKYGNYRTMLVLISFEIIALAGMIAFNSFVLIVPAFFIHFIFTFVFGINIDVLLEHHSKDEKTGGIRGTFLTLNNFAWVVVPVLAGFIVKSSNFWKAYLVSVIFLIPVLFLLASSFKNFKDPEYKRLKFWKTFKRVRENKDIKNIFLVGITMRIFFAIMIIYTPMYLLNHIGFSFSEMGIILTVAMLAYLLLEYPLGKIADKRFGEKEILTVGFIILSITTMIISFVTGTSLVLWAIIMFSTRVGA
ncbi:MAG: MFS transporter, partial [Patescibacteria group bacterium]